MQTFQIHRLATNAEPANNLHGLRHTINLPNQLTDVPSLEEALSWLTRHPEAARAIAEDVLRLLISFRGPHE